MTMATTNHIPQEVKLLAHSTSNGELTFPWKLHSVLEECERLGCTDIISWQGHNVFRIHDKKRFEDEIMIKYFKQTQYRSFQRQLNLYGFKRVKATYDTAKYTHQYFVRGKPELCCFMHRTKIKKKSKRGIDNKNTSVNSTTAEPSSCAYPVKESYHRSKQDVLGSNNVSQSVSTPSPWHLSYGNKKPVVRDDSSFSPMPIRETPPLHQLATQKDKILLPQEPTSNQDGLWKASPATRLHNDLFEQKQDIFLMGQEVQSLRVPETCHSNASCNLLNNCGYLAHGVDLDLDTIFDDTIA